jgi:actin-like protein 6A
MYCGDETGGVVFDAGSYTSKVGYAGDDLPKSVFAGRVGVLRAGTDEGGARVSALPTPKPRYIAGPSAAQFRPHMDLKPPTDFGLYDDWDAMEAVWRHGLDSIHCDPREHPMIMTEPPFSIMAQREKVAELMFEAFDVPALYLGRQPMLAAFSTGRSSGIVVDLGHSCTRVTALYDGIYMTSA